MAAPLFAFSAGVFYDIAMKRDASFAKTKIVATIGPSSQKTETLINLIEAGLDVARLNFSHGSYSDHAISIKNIKEAARRTENPLAILADLCGPKIRLGELAEPREVKAGETIVITTNPEKSAEGAIPTIYQDLARDVQPGDPVLIDDGLIRLEVLASNGTEARCRVINDGTIKSRKGINLPGIKVSTPSLTEKDREDIDFIVTQPIDFIALSFVRSREDIKELRWLLKDRGSSLPIIAKIEKPEAIEDLDGIIDEADGIMVARGDLGVEMKTEEVPILQKSIIRKSNAANKPVITATQMLESMIDSPRPTRAEASDVANAVFDGTDAVMLSGETSVGDYPVETVRTMDAIVRTAEQTSPESFNITLRRRGKPLTDAENIGRAACLMAEEAGAAAIIAITRSGRTPRLLSRYRSSVPVIAFTESEATVRYLNLIWGVQAELIGELGDTDASLHKARDLALAKGYIHGGDTIIHTTGIPLLESSDTNMIKIERLPE